MDEALLLQGMTDAQKSLFETEMRDVRKSTVAAAVLSVLLGWAGGHLYYLRRAGLGTLYLLVTCVFGGLLADVFMAPASYRVDLRALGLDPSQAVYGLVALAALPQALAVIGLLFVRGSVRKHNEARAEEIAIKIKALAAPAAAPAEAAPQAPAAPAPEPQPAAADATVMLPSGGLGADADTELGRLVILSGEDEGKRVPVYGNPTPDGFETTIGREQISGDLGRAHIHFADPEISRRQARIVCSGGQFRLVNLSQTNPTQVDGRPVGVDEGVPVVPGTRIRFGNIETEFQL